MCDIDPCQSCFGCMEGFEAHHWLRDPFDKVMILLKYIVQILYLANVDLPALAREFQDDVNRLKPRKVGAAFVDDNAIRHAVTVDHFLEKPACRRQVSPL